MSIVFTYITETNTTYSITFPNPDFQDQFSVTYNKFITQSRGKELIIGKKSGYDSLSKIIRLKYQFSFIPEPLKQGLLNLLDISFGKILQVMDYNSILYNVIATKPIEINNVGRGNNSFSFEAEVINIGLQIGPYVITQGQLSEFEVTQGYE